MNADKILSQSAREALGCKLWMPLNGDAKDYSGNGNDGSVNGMTYNQLIGKNGECGHFGNDDYISIPNSPDFQLESTNDTVAFSIWLNLASVSTDQFFVMKNYNNLGYIAYRLMLTAGTGYDMTFEVYGTTGYQVKTDISTTGEWVYLTCVANNGELKLYKNGSIVDEGTFSTVRSGNYPLYLSGNLVGTSRVASGTLMSQFMMFNKEPTQQQIRKLYNATYIE